MDLENFGEFWVKMDFNLFVVIWVNTWRSKNHTLQAKNRLALQIQKFEQSEGPREFLISRATIFLVPSSINISENGARFTYNNLKYKFLRLIRC
jgi:hypothetical protein